MAKDLPYFRWFPKDAESEEFYSSLPDAELGFHHRCLNRSWVNNGIPADLDALACSMKVNRKQLDKLWARVSAGWQEKDGRFYNKEQEEERSRAIAKGESNRRFGNANAKKTERESNAKKREGNANETRTRFSRDPNGTRRAYDSDSDSDSDSSKEPSKNKTVELTLFPENETAAGSQSVVRSDVSASCKTSDDLIIEAARRMYERHQRDRRCPVKEATAKLKTILRAVPRAERLRKLEAIESNHAAWCETSKWQEGFSDGLDNWLAPTMGRFDEPPPVLPVIPIRHEAAGHTKYTILK